MQPGLERTRTLLDLMADPQRAYPIIHVTGSNGKTSTSRMAASILSAHGLNVGTFTSPHLERVEERLGTNGHHATPEEFAAAITDVAPFVDILEQRTGERLTYFELTTAAAFAWFADRAVDIAVVEVGLGGRLDSTNVADAAVAVVTGISREHVKVLGTTIPEIAREKTAIAKPNSILVTGPLVEEALDVAATRAADLGITHRRFGLDFAPEQISLGVGGWMVDISGIYETYPEVFLPLHGRFQAVNLTVAVAAVEELFGRALDVEALREGVAAARSPGRLEVMGHHPLVIIDGAHNEEGFGALAAALDEEFLPTRWTMVVGALGDKDLSGMLGHVRGKVSTLIATAPESRRALAVDAVARQARDVLGSQVDVQEIATVEEAVRTAIELAGENGAVVIAGSLYVVGEARPVIKETMTQG